MLKKIIWKLIIVAAIVLAGFFAWQNRYNLYDWAILRSYTPTAEVKGLATESGMSDYGRRLFYVNKPKVSDREEFAGECNNNKEQTIVLGCYTGQNLYVFKVTDPRLKGAEEVTAAHEMLHAAYSRLSASERSKVDRLTAEALARVSNPRITEVVESYRKQDATIVPNELHSILGTEVENLGPELEAYYKKYFSGRTKVISLSQGYQSVIAEYKNKVEKYDADLSLRKAEIAELEASLTKQSAAISASRSQMSGYLERGQNELYNQQVPQFNASINSYNRQLSSYNQLLAEYNNVVKERNSFAMQQQDLAKSLDSRLNAISQ